jgi:tRNA A37 threonylcarbamoyladenosine dehydratase
MAESKIDYDSWQPVTVPVKTTIIKALAKTRLKDVAINDSYFELLEEWFLLQNPRFRFDPNHQEDFQRFLKTHLGKKTLDQAGQWFYYPWLKQVIHFLPEKMHQQLRTGRNRNLITEKEQAKFYEATVAVLGMSVGSHVALTIAMTGGARHLRLADPDTISGSNLNRIRTGYQNIGLPKTIAVARQVYEMNPYAQVEIFPEGLTEKNMGKILKDLDLLVEEMDNPYMKIRIRELARKAGIPVIMAADNADGIIVDVERFDKQKKRPLLHGIIGKMTAAEFKNVAPQDLPRVIAKIAGANIFTVRMLESVMEVGKTLYSWPQLGNAATLCGSVLTYLARQIIVGAPVPSGRTDFSVANFFLPPTKSELKKRDRIFKKLGIK